MPRRPSLPVLLQPDSTVSILPLLALLWVAAKVGGGLAQRLRLPSVVGELGVGMLLSSLHGVFPAWPSLAERPALDLLGQLGIVVLMFAVGLESTVPQMVKVGAPSLRVAIIGVCAPMAAGLAGAWALLPTGTPFVVDLFIGGCLCATSISISAQILRERGAVSSPEGRVIVGAAVLDDVLGLLVLAAVSGLAASSPRSGGLAWWPFVRTLALAMGFLAMALTLGRAATASMFGLASKLQWEELLLPLALSCAFFLAWAGSLAGLAPIVGAYAAGLILEPAQLRTLERREGCTLESRVQPLVALLAPLFFVLMGARVELRALLDPKVLLFALLLGLIGVGGKCLAGLGAGRGLRASIVGWGMVPRGEVGLIFVAAGANLRLNGAPLLSPSAQAAIIGALLLTTLAGPLGLARALRIRKGGFAA